MNIFSGKRHELSDMVERYLVKIEDCVKNFKNAINRYFEKCSLKEFEELIEQTHIAESLADDIRREIELSLYEKSLIPESRGDVLGLLESTDRVLNKAQSVLYQIETESLCIPDFIKDEFSKLIDINVEAFRSVVAAIRKLFKDIRQVRDITNEIDKRESSSDRLERDIIRKIFSSDIGIGEKILLKDLVIETGNISDLSEIVGDRLNIITVKRLI